MKISRVVLLLSVNFVATIVAYYRKCYEDFSLCLITNIDVEEWPPYRERKLNWKSASSWCQRYSSSLAIITNETVQSAIAAFIKDSSAMLSTDVITSGYRYWPADIYLRWTDGRLADINGYSNDNYAFLVSAQGTTYVSLVYLSTYKLQFICSFFNHDSSCPDDHLQIGRRCYKIHTESVTWFGARNICIKEGSDLANFDSTHIPSFKSETGRYWIGLHREIWSWRNGPNVKYSNWDEGKPGSYGSECLCLMASTAKWRNCDCSRQYRHVCIQDYASDSASTVTKSLTKIATATTETITTTTKMVTAKTKTKTTRTTPLKTTKSTTITIPTVDDSSSQFRSTSTQTLDDNSGNKMSEDPLTSPDTSGVLPAVGIGIACLLILVIVIAVVTFLKTRRRSSAPPTMSKDDTPSTVYAVVVPNANEPVRSPSQKAPNQTVYAELDLVPKRKITQNASEPFRSHSGKTTNPTVYAELDLVPREKTQRRDVDMPESEYANSLHVDTVYATIAQTRV